MAGADSEKKGSERPAQELPATLGQNLIDTDDVLFQGCSVTDQQPCLSWRFKLQRRFRISPCIIVSFCNEKYYVGKAKQTNKHRTTSILLFSVEAM